MLAQRVDLLLCSVGDSSWSRSLLIEGLVSVGFGIGEGLVSVGFSIGEGLVSVGFSIMPG